MSGPDDGASAGAAGCGGKSMTGGPGLDAGTTQDAASDAPASWSPECPASEPAMGSACMHDSLSCEYPSATQPGCDDVVVCAGGTWGGAVLPGGNPTCEPHTSSPGCPSQASAITPGATCAAARRLRRVHGWRLAGDPRWMPRVSLVGRNGSPLAAGAPDYFSGGFSSGFGCGAGGCGWGVGRRLAAIAARACTTRGSLSPAGSSCLA